MNRPGHLALLAISWVSPVASLVSVLGAIVLLASMASAVTQRTVTQMLINIVIVVGLYTFSGISGILSFGHASFMAVGAYTGALLTMPVEKKEILLPALPELLARTEMSTVAATLVGGGVASLFAVVVAVPLLRLTGIAAMLGTFSLLIIVHSVAINWRSVTGGARSILGVPLTTTMIVAFVWSIGAIVVAYVYQESRFGLKVRAAREDEDAARAAGISIPRARMSAFIVSAFFVAAGGGLYGQFIGSFNPDAFWFPVTFLTVAMLVVGGIRSLAGAVVGVMTLTAVGEVLRRVENGDVGALGFIAKAGLREVGMALCMLVILIFRPRGIMGGKELRLSIGNDLGKRRGGRAQPVPGLVRALDQAEAGQAPPPRGKQPEAKGVRRKPLRKRRF